LNSGQRHDSKKFQRVSALGLVRVQSSQKTYTATLVNISCGGLMLKGQDLPEAGEEITLSFGLAPFQGKFFLKAIVVWVAAASNPCVPRGMGVRFVNLDKDNEERIREYIKKSMHQA